MLRAQENSCGSHLLQARPRPHQDQRLPHRARRARDPKVQGLRAHPPTGTTPLRRSRHADQSQGRWPHLADLRHSSEHSEGLGCFLPEVRGRAEQEGNQGHSRQV